MKPQQKNQTAPLWLSPKGREPARTGLLQVQMFFVIREESSLNEARILFCRKIPPLGRTLLS